MLLHLGLESLASIIVWRNRVDAVLGTVVVVVVVAQFCQHHHHYDDSTILVVVYVIAKSVSRVAICVVLRVTIYQSV